MEKHEAPPTKVIIASFFYNAYQGLEKDQKQTENVLTEIVFSSFT